jgi:membrane protein
MVLLLWLYISGLIFIVGAEMNAEIEHASEHGKAAGEKKPGERKTIGARAAREFRERQRHAPGPEPRPVAAPVRPRPAAATTAFARTGVLAGGALAALFRRRIRE